MTAAGSAGLIKVLLAMKHRQLPATANYESASLGIVLDDSPFTVLDKARPWQQRGDSTPRRAAISAFGFGGINAHVLLQEWDESQVQSEQANLGQAVSPPESQDIAIVGMDTYFGSWQSLTEFTERLFDSGRSMEPAPLNNTWGIENSALGYTIDHVDIPLGRFRIPPNEIKDMLPQQLLMLQVAANALLDAGIEENRDSELKSAGVYIGIGLDLSTTNFHLRWHLLSSSESAYLFCRGLPLDCAAEESSRSHRWFVVRFYGLGVFPLVPELELGL